MELLLLTPGPLTIAGYGYAPDVRVAATEVPEGRTVEEMEDCDPGVLAGEVSPSRQALYDAGAHLGAHP